MRRFVFGDESGDFCFSPSKAASKYFIVCTVATVDAALRDRFANLYQQLKNEGLPVGDYFHCTTDKQPVRDRVFALIKTQRIGIHASILEKSKAQPQTRIDDATFYKYGWYLHLSGTSIAIQNRATSIEFCTAALGTGRGKKDFKNSVRSVVNQRILKAPWETAFPHCKDDYGLQVADYCTWAIQRKWEKSDDRSHQLIKHLIYRERDCFQRGDKHYYQREE